MRKYQLAKKLDKKYRAIAQQRYKEFGCNDALYKLACKLFNIASRILNKNGWDNTYKTI